MSLPILRRKSDLRAAVADWHAAGQKVAVVPTMGALHEGHLSLVRTACAGADRVIVTIFVNPTQFNDAADLDNYPRTEQADAEKLAPFAVDVIYAPDPDQIYPDGFATSVSVSGVSEGLCGAHRPGHFDGVATVVAKLLLQTRADAAYFGEKDFQQLQLVRRLTRDLDIDAEIVGCPTVRESDGLALSSRNLRLTDKGRQSAPALYAAMQAAASSLQQGAPLGQVVEATETAITAAGFSELEYLELRAENGLTPLTAPTRPARLLAAAWIDGIRLIDNIAV